MTATKDHSLASPSSLSAMFDGEATQQDINSLLNESSVEINSQLESFHLIQQTLHKESAVFVGLQDSFVSRIRAKIEEEALSNKATYNQDDSLIVLSEHSNVKVSKSTWPVMFSSMAIAASVTFVVIFSGNTFFTPKTSNVATIVDVSAPVSGEDTLVASLAELNKEDLPADNIRLQHYLREHAEQAAMTVGQGMIPMARVVSYPIEE